VPYIIRTLEMYVCSAVPSAISLWIIYKVPNFTLWNILCIISFIICLAANIWLWYDYIMHTGNDNIAFYSVNSIAFIAFMTGAVVLYKFANAQLFSIAYSGMRLFENLKIHNIQISLHTTQSVAVSFGILALFMVLTKLFAVRLFGMRVSGEDLNALMMEETEDETMTLYNIRKKREQMQDKESTEEESDK
jgi:hypothetical protein